MKHSRDYIAGLLDKFVDGLTTEAEEQNLAEYFDTADEIPTEWESYKEMFMSFKTDGYDFSEEEVEAWIAPEAAPMPATPKHSVNMWRWDVRTINLFIRTCGAGPPQWLLLRQWWHSLPYIHGHLPMRHLLPAKMLSRRWIIS